MHCDITSQTGHACRIGTPDLVELAMVVHVQIISSALWWGYSQRNSGESFGAGNLTDSAYSQTWTVPSSPAEASGYPCGLNATA
jgi:hypothetical protein